jgi:UDP-sugar pyrophosphorylase
MVSADTVDKTKALLEKEGNFGIDITLMLQEKVPALSDSNASLVLSEEDQYVLDAKPHGHGDVHVLMHKEGVAKAWAQRGVKWVAFFQDTNGLAFTTLPAALGVSVALGLEVNSVAVPRAAKQAVGALAKLKHTDGREMTINVEYNQLDPLLRATISPDGDVNDSVTGKSIFPGNINQLIFALEPYVVNLERTNGVMAEFVNPKYKDETKQAFKKPTRLECMMQDYPKELDGNAKVGFTQFPVWVCYSPCKNNSTDAAESIKKGVPAGSAWTAESDQYRAQAELLKLLGCNIDTSSEPVEFQGIPAVPGPRIIIDGTTAVFYSEMKNIFPNPSAVNISANSTLVVNGDVVIQELELDGALTLDAAKGSKLQVWASGDASKVVNAGHKLVALDATITENVSEIDSMRGFKMEKKEEKIVDTSTKQLVEGGKNIFVFTGNQLILEEHFDEPSPLNQACKSVFGFC